MGRNLVEHSIHVGIIKFRRRRPGGFHRLGAIMGRFLGHAQQGRVADDFLDVKPAHGHAAQMRGMGDVAHGKGNARQRNHQ